MCYTRGEKQVEESLLMGQHSAIEWTDHTFNPWWGCVKVSPGCTHCYAETWAKRYGHNVWGKKSHRRFFGETHWSQPKKWNKQATSNNVRMRVFCASMADVFEDNPLLESERDRLWELIEQTPMLDWLLLTKRPENMMRLAPWKDKWPTNVWALATIENQEYARKRLPYLIEVPSMIRGLSVEPMIGPVDLTPWLNDIHWVIAGGESGPDSRPMNPEWVKFLRDQCIDANVAFFFKQWGNWIPSSYDNEGTLLHLKSLTGKRESIYMERVRKKIAGHELDGSTWAQLPVPT